MILRVGHGLERHCDVTHETQIGMYRKNKSLLITCITWYHISIPSRYILGFFRGTTTL